MVNCLLANPLGGSPSLIKRKRRGNSPLFTYNSKVIVEEFPEMFCDAYGGHHSCLVTSWLILFTCLISSHLSLIILFLFHYHAFNENISDWIYENMASVSVYRPYAKCVHGTKTLTLPTQDNAWLSVPPTELCNYHDNHSQQRPDSAG